MDLTDAGPTEHLEEAVSICMFPFANFLISNAVSECWYATFKKWVAW